MEINHQANFEPRLNACLQTPAKSNADKKKTDRIRDRLTIHRLRHAMKRRKVMRKNILYDQPVPRDPK